MIFSDLRTKATIGRYRLTHSLRDGLYGLLLTTPLKDKVKQFERSYQAKTQERALEQWKKYGTQSPVASDEKHRIIISFGQRFHLPILVETGTYHGDTVEAVKNSFQQIFSIELAPKLFENAKKRFSKDAQVTILLGDSATVLPELLQDIKKPSLFWLDGHYSGDNTASGSLRTPVLIELRHILQHPIVGHVILIDDARYFIGAGDYPTLEELRKYITSLKPGLAFEVKDDIIRIFPSQTFSH